MALAAAAGMMWRAVDQGIFSTGRGPAYQAWRDWRERPDGGLEALVGSAVLAANGHNSQPWIFALGPNRIDLFADPARNIGAMDPLRREMYVSLGCALESLVLAARAIGFVPTVRLLPQRGDETFGARVELASDTSHVSRLYQAISHRHTNRAPYIAGRLLEPGSGKTRTSCRRERTGSRATPQGCPTSSGSWQRFFRLSRERATTSSGWRRRAQVVLPFRIGYPKVSPILSPRRPAQEVIRTR